MVRKFANLALAPGLDGGIIGRPFNATVPAIVLVRTIGVVLTVVLVVLAVV